MQTVTLQEAQARLPELIAGAQDGEEIVLTEDARPVAKLTMFTEKNGEEPRGPIAGSARGMIIEREDCWEPDVEIWKEYM